MEKLINNTSWYYCGAIIYELWRNMAVSLAVRKNKSKEFLSTKLLEADQNWDEIERNKIELTKYCALNFFLTTILYFTLL